MKKHYSAIILAGCIVLAALLAGSIGEQCVWDRITNVALTSNSMQTATALPTQLALGTLSLEESSQALTPAQAAELLPLWKAVNSLSTSENVTTVEMNAVYQQIQEAMTAEQLEAIQSIDLNSQGVAVMAERYGVSLYEGGSEMVVSVQSPSSNTSEGTGKQMEGIPADAGIVGETGGMDPGGEAPPPNAGTQSSMTGNSPMSSQDVQNDSSSLLYQAVVDLLKKLVVG
jgi:hypothetical protein